MRLRLTILILLISLTPVYAQTKNLQDGFDALTDKAPDGDFRDIKATGMAALAFREAGGFDRGKQSVDVLLDLDDTCWPSGNCKVRDTAITLLALEEYAEDTDLVLDWFEQAQTPATAVGDWYLEIITSQSGTCKVAYDTKEINVKVAAGHFPDCKNSTFFDLDACLEPGLLTKSPSIEFDIDCTALGAGTKIAMVYQTGTSYYLISEAATTRTTLPVSNACFGETSGAPCSVDASLYANWALDKARSKITVLPWLEDNYIKVNELQTAFIYLSSGNADHLQQLKDMQNVDGNFDDDIFTTAVATLALKESASQNEFDSAKAWLILRQRTDGSWGDAFTTATVLYAIYDNEDVQFRGIAAAPAVTVCNEDGICDSDFGENALNCAFDCYCGDDTCDSTESYSACPADCEAPEEFEPATFCGDGVCQVDEDNKTCPADCPKEGGLPWFWIILIILLLAGAFFLYFKFYKKKPKQVKPVKIQPGQLPRRIIRRPAARALRARPVRARKTKTESELEKSLREAKKLLKK